MDLSRRHFLLRGSAFAMGFAGLQSAFGRGLPFGDMLARGDEAVGYGPLIPDPAGVLDLPRGFSYRVISRAGEEMDDGLIVPGRHDGMAAFPGPDGTTILVRNHETDIGWEQFSPFGPGGGRLSKIDVSRIYDRGRGGQPAFGGTTTVVYNTETGRVEKHYLSLAGTVYNCAGGPTPWGTWLTCEETARTKDAQCDQDHGWVFEVEPTTTAKLQEPKPIRAMGRFRHEAVAVDPKSGVCYLSEDMPDGLLYRYIPTEPGKLLRGGRLQALKVRGSPSLITDNHGATPDVPVGAKLEVEWIDVDDIEAPKDDLRHRGFAAGATRFARTEGMWYGRESVFFACTTGGHAQLGQIWRYTPSPVEGTPGESQQPGILELFVEPNDATMIKNADNLTVSGWGDLIVCEDSPKMNGLVGVTPRGEIYRLANNALNDAEFAGATFSPDGSTLFCNIQTPGLTLAITGPWKRA